MTPGAKRPAPMAICRSCGAPLIGTFAFRKHEFYCLECGRPHGWLDPHAAEPSAELNARYEALHDEWQELSAGLIGEGLMYRECPNCSMDEPHWNHATDEEKAADELARERLRLRAEAAA